jgi:hypothetical protein
MLLCIFSGRNIQNKHVVKMIFQLDHPENILIFIVLFVLIILVALVSKILIRNINIDNAIEHTKNAKPGDNRPK